MLTGKRATVALFGSAAMGALGSAAQIKSMHWEMAAPIEEMKQFSSVEVGYEVDFPYSSFGDFQSPVWGSADSIRAELLRNRGVNTRAVTPFLDCEPIRLLNGRVYWCG